MSKLTKIALTFGDSANNPKELTSAQIDKIIRTIQDSSIETTYNGFITCNTSISGSKAFLLDRSGINYLGPVIPDDYSISASKSTIAEGDEIIMSVNGVVLESIYFTVKDVTITSGDATKQEVLDAFSVVENKIIFGSLGKKVDAIGTVVIEANTLYKPDNKKTITLNINSTHSEGLITTYEKYDYDTTVDILNFNIITDKVITVAPRKVGGVPLDVLEAKFENETPNYTIVSTTTNTVTIRCNNINSRESNKVLISAKEVSGYTVAENVEVNIDNRVITVPSIVVTDNIIAKNGKGNADYLYSFNPGNYTVPVALKSIQATINNGTVEISNSTIAGFTCTVNNVTQDATINITAIITVDKKDITIHQTIPVTYKQVFNEFKVYKDSAWIVPNSNIEVKVGDVVAEYIGDGLWMVDDSLVNESMDVIAGDIVLGKYGKQEYSDGSEEKVEKSNDVTDGNSILINKFVHYIVSTKKEDCVLYANGDKIYNGKTPNLSTEIKNILIKAGYSDYGFGINVNTYIGLLKVVSTTSNTYYSCISFNSEYNPLIPDLSFSKTSLIAKNGTLNELITPTTPNGGTIVVEGVNSSNPNITAIREGNNIKLTGSIADGNPQTATISVHYTVNGYRRSYDVEITATYQESMIPFVIYNPTANAISFDFQKNGTPYVLPLQIAIVDDYTDDESYDFDSVNLESTPITETKTITLESGQAIMIATGIGTWRKDNNSYWHFSIQTQGLTFGGDIYALVDGLNNGAIKSEYALYFMFKNCKGITKTPKLYAIKLTNNCYFNMFNSCVSLTDAPELPAITLSDYCYANMFNGCTSLINTPELPATTLALHCYNSMFTGCTSLITGPELPGKTLQKACYSGMFQNCISLVNPPTLPATILIDNCYNSMFAGCTSLVNPPELPATTLAYNCYYNMFYNCTSLVNAPDLPATILQESCYNYMFYNCSNLKYIKALFLTTPSVTYTKTWTQGVSSTGTFVKNTEATWDVRGDSGIPTNWTVETAIN